MKQRKKSTIDFSVNTNSLGVSEVVCKNFKTMYGSLEHYPDKECESLRRSLAKKYSISNQTILIGNGADELIYRLIFASKPKKAIIVEPTYEEYERALNLIDCLVMHYQLRPESNFVMGNDIINDLTQDVDMVFLCNPNNPTGNLLDNSLLDKIIETCQIQNILLVIDESFIEFVPKWEYFSKKKLTANYPNIFIIDSFTKTFSLAGFRLGFCVSNNFELLKAMKRFGQSHGVSTPAQLAGIWSLDDEEYLQKTYDDLLSEREWMIAQLKTLEVDVWLSQGNFLLLKFQEASIINKLTSNGIKTRDCTKFYGLGKEYCRISIRSHQDNESFIAALSDILKKG